MAFRWPSPCVSGQVYSTDLGKLMPRTWDKDCLRGDRVGREKSPGEYRVVFLGGSTVQDFQSDEEMMTARFKEAALPAFAGRRLTVLNAGRSALKSRTIRELYASRIREFSPDLVFYYEAWNEQPTDIKPGTRADNRIAAMTSRLHDLLHHRVLLYTYLIEKYAFTIAARNRFWKIDVNELREHFTGLVRDVQTSGARFVFVTQVLQFPRMWKRADTFDYDAVNALIDRLAADRAYAYDVREISALNQRLAVAYSLRLCRELNVPVIDIREDVEGVGEDERKTWFMDLGHLTVRGDRMVGQLVARAYATMR